MAKHGKKKSAAQLDREIRDRLWNREGAVGGGRPRWLSRPRTPRTHSTKATHTQLTVTPFNIAVLAELAHGRREFPNAIGASQSHHVQRSLKAGLVEIVGKRRGRQIGDRMRITPFGYEAIMDLMATDPYYAEHLRAPIGEYTPVQHRFSRFAEPETTATPARRSSRLGTP